MCIKEEKKEIAKKVKLNKTRKICAFCNDTIPFGRIYCSQECKIIYEKALKLNELLSGKNLDYMPRTIKSIMIFHFGHRCFCCKNDNWMGSEIPLELHHEDGNFKNNTIHNLLLLCPNCHAQTDNYKAKNKKSERTYRKKYYQCLRCKKTLRRGESRRCTKCQENYLLEEERYKCVKCFKPISKGTSGELCMSCFNKNKAKVQNRPSRKKLIELITTKPFVQIGHDYNVSDNAIRKWCKSENLPHRSRDIKAQKDALLKELVVSVIKG